MNLQNSRTRLSRAYDVRAFRKLGHELIDLLSDQLEKTMNDLNEQVIPYRSPEEELAFWQHDLLQETAPMETFQQILDHSIKVHHPRCIGHQVSVPALIASLSGMMTDLLSNGTGVYEMGMASNALEKVLTDWLAQKIGFREDAAGFITSGGSLANLTALLAARKSKAPGNVWEAGHQEKLAVMVSSEAHYCIDRAARILGMGSEGIIKVPVDEFFKIRIDQLEPYYQKAKNEGFKVIALIGCACSTATGSYDPLEKMADFAEKKGLWFHVDGAHGGAVVVSKKYRHLAKGIERADSVVIDFHKMMMTPSLNTALVFKRGVDSYKTFQQKAQYLWDAQQTEEWYHAGKRSFECTKLMLSTKVYSILKAYGEEVFEENVDQLYDMARRFAEIIRQREPFELALEPEANIVNFRFINGPKENLNKVNGQIRQALMESGKFYIVQTLIGDKRFLRTSIMNPLTRESDLVSLLDEVERLGYPLLTQH